MVALISRRRIMRRFSNGATDQVVTWATIVVLVVLGFALVLTSVLPVARPA